MNLLHKIRRVVFLPCFAILFAQQPFREFIPMEGAASASALPPDYRNKSELVLTAPTRELQRFLLKHLKNKAAFEKPDEWKRR